MVRYNAIRTVKPTAEQRTLLAGRQCPALHTARNWMSRIASEYYCNGCTRAAGWRDRARAALRDQKRDHGVAVHLRTCAGRPHEYPRSTPALRTPARSSL